MADSCLPAIGVEVSAEGVGRHYGARKDGGLLDGWLIHDTDTANVPGVEVRAVPLLMTDDDATAEMVRTALELMLVTDHAAARIEIVPVLGIGELRPGDDLAELIAAARDRLSRTATCSS